VSKFSKLNCCNISEGVEDMAKLRVSKVVTLVGKREAWLY